MRFRRDESVGVQNQVILPAFSIALIKKAPSCNGGRFTSQAYLYPAQNQPERILFEDFPLRGLRTRYIRLGPRERGERVNLPPELSRFAARRRLE